jgi:hypothetical protein
MFANWKGLLSGRRDATPSVSLSEACFDADLDEAKLLIHTVTIEGGLVIPEIVRASAAARVLHDELGLPIILGDARALLARTPAQVLGTVARNCNLLRTVGFFTSTLCHNGVLFTITGRRHDQHDCGVCRDVVVCPHQEYIVHLKREALIDRTGVFEIFDATTDAKAMLVDR